MTAIRATFSAVIAQGGAVCAICHRVIRPGQRWDVEHIVNRDTNPELTYEKSNLTVAHRACNRAAGARYGNGKRRKRPRLRRLPEPSRDW